MGENREILINNLSSLPAFMERYKELKCINYDSTNKVKKRGYFSLVFQAYDVLEKQFVAIKFFDPDPRFIRQTYRIEAFNREPLLLTFLKGKRRCLQLISGLKTYNLDINISSTETLTFPCNYFVTEWIDKDIDSYFFNQSQIDTITKLRLFNEIILAIEAIHQNNIFHRDIKPDNFRAYEQNLKRIIVAIDLGTAARFDSYSIDSEYPEPIGSILYSSPEAYCGLASNRQIAFYSDYYALGCLLYELFCYDTFYAEINKKGFYELLCGTLSKRIEHCTSIEDMINIYNTEIKRLKFCIALPRIMANTSSAPKSITNQLNEIIYKLSSLDYSDRTRNLEAIRTSIWNCINTLENEKYERRKNEIRRRKRLNRSNKAREKERRLRQYINSIQPSIS